MEFEEGDLDIWATTKNSWLSLLNLNLSEDEILSLANTQQQLLWKILILDEYAEQALAPILHVGDLRLRNITLHFPLHSKR